jgi:hypothetical protein
MDERALSDMQHAIEDELGCKANWLLTQPVQVMDGPRIMTRGSGSR